MAVIGSLVADLAANSAAFNRDLSSATRNLRSNSAAMNRSLGAIDRQFAQVRAAATGFARSVFSIRGAVAGLAAAGGIAYAGRQALQAADDMAKLADRTGLTVEAISALEYQASQTGALQSYESGIETFAEKMGELRTGTGELISFLQNYDQAVLRNLRNSRDQAEALDIVADALQRETDASLRARLAAVAFGGAGVDLTNTFRGGSEAIRQYRREAEQLNLVLGDEGARNAEALNDELDRMVRSMRMEWTIAVTNHADEVLSLAQAWQDVKLGVLEAGIQIGRFLRLGGFQSDAPRPGASVDTAIQQAIRARELSQRVELVPAAARGQDVQDFLGRDFTGRAWTEAMRQAAEEGLAYGARRERAIELQREAIAAELARLADVFQANADLLSQRRKGSQRPLLSGDGADRPGRSPADASPSTLTGLLDQVERDVQARRDERAAAAQSLFEATRTAAETYRLELERIAGLEGAGAFAEAGGAETAGRGRVAALIAMAQATDQVGTAMREAQALADQGLISEAQLMAARDQIQALGPEVRTLMDELRSATDNLFISAQNEVLAFAEGFQTMGETVRGVIRSIVREMMSLALQRFLFTPMRNAMNGFLDNLSFGGFGFGGGGGGKSIPKFQRGGSFTVGGAGGVDSQLVMFKASPGENVQVTPTGAAGLRYGGGGAVVVERIVEKAIPIVITEGEMFAARVGEIMQPGLAAAAQRGGELGKAGALSEIGRAQRLNTRR